MTDRRYYDYCCNENPMVDNDAILMAVYAKGMNQKDFAEAIGVSYHTVRNRFKYGNWTVLEAYRVSELLGVSLKLFFAFPEKLAG